MYQKLKNYNRAKVRQILIVFDHVIPDIEDNKKLSPIVTELFL